MEPITVRQRNLRPAPPPAPVQFTPDEDELLRTIQSYYTPQLQQPQVRRQPQQMPQTVQTARAAGSLVQNVGRLAGDRQLSQFGGSLGLGANIAGAIARPGPATIAPLALRALGVNPIIGSAISGAFSGGNKLRGAAIGAAAGALAMKFPPLGILSALSGIFGGPTIGSIIGRLFGGGRRRAPAPVTPVRHPTPEEQFQTYVSQPPQSLVRVEPVRQTEASV